MAVSVPVLYFLVPLALLLAALGVAGFLWAVRNGQYDDVETPALRVVIEDEEERDRPAPGHPGEEPDAGPSPGSTASPPLRNSGTTTNQNRP